MELLNACDAPRCPLLGHRKGKSRRARVPPPHPPPPPRWWHKAPLALLRGAPAHKTARPCVRVGRLRQRTSVLTVLHAEDKRDSEEHSRISPRQLAAPNFPLDASPPARPLRSSLLTPSSPDAHRCLLPPPPPQKGVSQYHNYLVMGSWRNL